MAKRLGFEIRPKTVNKLVNADETPLQVRGECSAPIRISDFVGEIDFAVVNKLQHHVIIGIDFLRKYKACVDVGGLYLTLGLEDRVTVPMIKRFAADQILRVCEDMDLPSMKEAFIRVYLPRGYSPRLSIIEALNNPWQTDGQIQHKLTN